MSDNESDSNSTAYHTIWDNIQTRTIRSNRNLWLALLDQEKSLFQIRFKDAYLEACKVWLKTIIDFINEDETWNAIEEAQSRINETINDIDEALLAAIDIRKYKIFQTIDWDALESDILEDQHFSNTDEFENNSVINREEQPEDYSEDEDMPPGKRYRLESDEY